ncbi:Glycosyl transferase, family 2 [Candidatus Promineifilum breve]|uniref:Glycosyl transferase, family 2 n=1 Tax=Candidatus Promineifilum breve TaxID=1806508 RepID=A0A160T2D9_9CHLR|nr:glycosyltransferase family A protein [Candidatus Promineifilum breve]CUS03399.2 Glycosyl transferase, family 2 [Candidatus Promineifilum breve]
MTTTTPRVTIGLPIYNGQNYLAETMDSLLAQTFRDFELVISDNASTDGTEAICRDYAARDPRVRYHRNEVNVGASANYNRTFELGRGQYFKWAAHDDLLAPTFLERCVAALDRDPAVVLAYTQAKAIDDKGQVVKVYPGKHHFNAPTPRERFYEFVLDPHPVVAVFGLMRREALARTRLIGQYAGSDRPLLSEMSLLGKFHEVPEHLFFYRFHEEQSWGGNKSAQAQQAWYDPRRAGKVTFPQWRLLREHVRSIERSPVGLKDRASCYLYMGYWMLKNRRRLGRNLLLRDA